MYRITPFEFRFVNQTGTSDKKLFSTMEIKFKESGIVLVSGDSGSGKSTFLNLLKGLIPRYIPGELIGNFYFNDIEVGSKDFELQKNKIVYLFQNPFSQLIHRNLSLEFSFTLENMNSLESEFLEKKKILSQKFGLDSLWDQVTFNLSNGECQKLVLASLIALGPKVILLDEPTAFLDPVARSAFYQLLSELKKDHLIFLVDHHLDEIQSIIDETIWINSSGYLEKNNIKMLTELENKSNELMELRFNDIAEVIKLSLKDISFYYSPEKMLFNHINAEFKSGEVVVIKGMNGRGKSTFFKVLACILEPKSGVIEYSINNKRLKKSEVVKNIGFVFQNPENNFFYDFLWQEFNGGNQRLINLFFNASELLRSPYLFSEGQKRRISILINIILNKKVIFLDEPTFGQDQKNIDKITQIINELKKCNYLIFIISHNEKFIKEVANHVFEIKDQGLYAVK